MLVQETIQPLLRYFDANVTAPADTSVISIANAQAVRIVAHTGTVTGTASLQVHVNDTNNTNNSTQLTDKAIASLASNRTYEIFVTGAEAYAAKTHASHMFVRIAGTGTAQIAIEISAFPGRSVPASLPANWTRVL